ncbi:Protein KTI12-like protein [Hibiscus syriacus]|uniref:Protein KTI12-like protein n=1 Tax=Hibiscus syriacus TaxID=106335 RepID=A0A6A2XUL1_HIBSY|nr:Protein KTI12-like protein [Hibiscus syriacus]
MTLVVICGQSCSRKSTAAICLAEALNDLECKQTVRIIDEASFHLERNQSYAYIPAEKNLRGVLRSEVDRSVSKDNIIIVDSLNSIKGYRYELWCLARAAGIRYCVVYCDVEDMQCRKWNEDRREKGEAAYNDVIFEDLVRRIYQVLIFPNLLDCLSYEDYGVVIDSLEIIGLGIESHEGASLLLQDYVNMLSCRVLSIEFQLLLLQMILPMLFGLECECRMLVCISHWYGDLF